MFSGLSGYKTYIAGIMAIAGTVAAVLSGDMSYADAAQIIVPAIIGMFIKNGQTNGTSVAKKLY